MTKPTTIFKYEPLTLRAIQNLKASSVYFGSPTNFNDPYDCALTTELAPCDSDELERLKLECVDSDAYPPEIRAKMPDLSLEQFESQIRNGAEGVLKKAAEKFLNTNAVTCFSETNDNLLMWSHYSSHHKGFVLEFDTNFEPFNKLQRVEYTDEMPRFSIADFVRNENHDKLRRLFSTKSSDWAYEKEWRALHNAAGTVFTYERAALKSIYFGPKISRQDMDLLCFVCHSQFPTTKLFVGTRSVTKFAVEFEEIPEYIPYLEACERGLTS